MGRGLGWRVGGSSVQGSLYIFEALGFTGALIVGYSMVVGTSLRVYRGTV